MNFLITAGNTQVLIDKVRCLTNIFTGQTGARIAREAFARGHAVTLATSHPETAPHCGEPDNPAWKVIAYRTFEDLQQLMEQRIKNGSFDAIVHTAAVSDYLAGGVFAPAPGTAFDPRTDCWSGPAAPALLDRAAGKVKSDEPELWLRLVRAPKLIDRIRADWEYRGVLVKFKLEVGIDEVRLLDIAERSRRQSDADLMVANTLEGSREWALLGPVQGRYERIGRADLAWQLVIAVEACQRERQHG